MKNSDCNFILFVCLSIVLGSCRSVSVVEDEVVRYLQVDDQFDDDIPAIDSIIAPYKASLDSTMSEELAYTTIPLIKERPDGSLCRWFAAAFHHAAQTLLVDDTLDVTIQNYGGLRLPEVASGPITVRTIYELMPFDNTVVFMDLTGQEVRILVDHIASSNGWPIYGVQYKIVADRAEDILINGIPLDDNRSYAVALPDYVANGGGGPDFLKVHDRVDSGVMIRDIMIEYLRDRRSQGDTQAVIPPRNVIES